MENKNGLVSRDFEKISANRCSSAEPNAEDMKFNESRYRAIIENQLELVIIFLPDFKISFVNEAMCQYFGSTPAEMLGKNLFHSVVEEDIDFLISAIRNLVFGIQNKTESRVINPKGEVCWTEWSGKAIFDGNRLLEYLVVGRDITDRKKMEDALIRSEANFRKLAEALPVAVFVYQDASIRYVNSAFLDLTKYSNEEIMEYEPCDMLDQLDFDEIIRATSIARQNQEVISPYKVRLVSKDGEDIWGYLSADIIDYEGRPAIVGVIMDIDNNPRIEEKILKVSKLESLGLLAGGIAHDFNNILTVIAGNISIAKMRHHICDDALEMLEEAEKATFQACALTQQLLTF
ncbi:MAG: PAS domain S-box protein, partial [Clostridium sp.]|nr:PAS domain S-box protein [Clostridium sp.]